LSVSGYPQFIKLGISNVKDFLDGIAIVEATFRIGMMEYIQISSV